MSRVSNLQSIRLNYFNSWNCDWYEPNYTGIMLAKDLRIRCYISGIFKRLKSITSNVYIKQTVNLSYYTFDLYIEHPIVRSRYKSLFYELNKYYSFCFYFYYSYFQYYYLKQKQVALVESVHMNANTPLDSTFNYNFLSKNKLFKTDYNKIIFSKLLFSNKKRQVWEAYNTHLKQIFSIHEEEVLDFNTKYLMYSHLNFHKKNKYSLIQDWTDQASVITKKTSYILNRCTTLFLLLSYLGKQSNFVLSKLNIYHFQKYFTFNVSTSNYYPFFLASHTSDNTLAFLHPLSSKVTSFYSYWSRITYIFFFLFFRVPVTFFFSSYILKLHACNQYRYTPTNKSLLSKLIHFKSKRYLRRIRMFKQTKRFFLTKTYLKKYFFFFFNFFFKEMEQTINFYFYKKTNMFSNIVVNCNLFLRNFKEYPTIRDAKFMSDYVSLGLNNKFSVNKIFYKIRDLQFKNYYFRNYLKKRKKNIESINSLFDMVSDKKYPILGIRIECSGSYKPGSRKKKKYYGEVIKDVELVHKSPNNSIYADLDFHQSFSRLKSGSIGIKVWVFFKTDLYNNNKHYISLVTSS